MIAIFRILMKERMPFRYRIRNNRSQAIGTGMGVGALACMALVLYGMKNFLDYFILAGEDRTYVILTNGLILSFFYLFISALLQIIYAFNYLGDYPLFLSLPVRVSDIMWGKILYIMVSKAAIVGPLLLLPVLIYGLYQGCPPVYWIKAIAVIVLQIVFLITAMGLIVFLGMSVINWNKIKDVISVLIQLGLVTVLTVFVLNAGQITEVLVGRAVISEDSALYLFYAGITDFIIREDMNGQEESFGLYRPGCFV